MIEQLVIRTWENGKSPFAGGLHDKLPVSYDTEVELTVTSFTKSRSRMMFGPFSKGKATIKVVVQIAVKSPTQEVQTAEGAGKGITRAKSAIFIVREDGIQVFLKSADITIAFIRTARHDAMRGLSVKIVLKFLSAGFLALCTIVFPPALQAETNSASGGNGASAHIDFIIHIPQALSLEIKIPHGADRSPSQNIETINPLTAAQGTANILVRAAGTLSSGGVMALTATGSDPLSLKTGYPVMHAGINWAANRTIWTGGFPMKPSYFISANHQNSSAFTFQKSHSRRFGDTSNSIFYIISSP